MHKIPPALTGGAEGRAAGAKVVRVAEDRASVAEDRASWLKVYVERSFRNRYDWGMPARPAYFHRISEAIEVLRGLSSEWIDRRTLEETLGVSKTVAWRILRRCGAVEGWGHSLVCGRGELIRAFETLQKTGEYEYEIRRRERLEDRLLSAAAATVARRIQVASGRRAAEMATMRFRGLPAGVDLKGGRLVIEFSGMADFLEKVGAIVYALQNDYEAVRAFLEQAPQPFTKIFH